MSLVIFLYLDRLARLARLGRGLDLTLAARTVFEATARGVSSGRASGLIQYSPCHQPVLEQPPVGAPHGFNCVTD